jgi:dienelactone hydrolase
LIQSSCRSLVVVVILLGIATVITTGQSGDPSPGHQSFASDLQTRNAQLPIQLRGHKFVLHTYLPVSATVSNRPVVLYISGASGWHAFDDHIAGTMAAHGAAVYGFSLHSYLTAFYDSHHPATVENLGEDYWLLMKEVRRVARLDESTRMILSGWSLGAGYALIAAANPQIKPHVKGVICVAVSRDNESFYSLVDALKSKFGMQTRGPFLDAAKALKEGGSTTVAILQAERDKSASPKEADMLLDKANVKTSDTLRVSIVKGASNHRFDGARKDFDDMLGQALDWISTTASNAN